MPRITTSERGATRSRFIDAAKTEFAERGLAGARFDEISLAAGHAKGTIYNYFATKEALFFTIVEDWCGQLVAGFVPNPGEGAEAELREIARLDVEIARKDPALARVVINQVPGLAPSHNEAVAAAIAPGVNLLTEVIAAGQASGLLANVHAPRTLARLFLTTLSGIEQEALADDSELDLDDVVNLVERLFISGLRR